MRIEDIDINMKADTLGDVDVKFYNVRKAPFKIYGLYNPETEDVFKRLPDDIGEYTNPGVARLYKHTAGGRVRFKTNSKFIAIKVKLHYSSKDALMYHMPFSGTSGFDIYVDGKFLKVFVPTAKTSDIENDYEAITYFDDDKERDIIISFPLYNGVDDLYIGLEEGATLGEGNEYKYKTPIVYYGSSITQGGVASKPSNAYEQMISKWLDADYINLGFSGSGRAEDIIADYVADMDMSVFVYDYDHNAPDAEYLSKTHEKMFKKVRAKHPDVPVIFASRPGDNDTKENIDARRKVVYTTYQNAISNGDKNVYYIDGQTFFPDEYRDDCTIERTHPNDLGFHFMAKKFYDIIKEVIK